MGIHSLSVQYFQLYQTFCLLSTPFSSTFPAVPLEATQAWQAGKNCYVTGPTRFVCASVKFQFTELMFGMQNAKCRMQNKCISFGNDLKLSAKPTP
jgi:hypothetical protein